MAKITRYPGNLKAFASEALGTERTIFGDTSQSDTLADNITTDFFRGWGIVGVNENPTKQDFNGLAFTLGQLLTYLHQSGVPEWDDEQEYHQNSMANRNGAIYVCKTDDHVSATPPESDPANWFKWLDENDVGLTNDLIATNSQRLRQEDIDVAGGADVTLTEAETTAGIINLTGTITADIAVIVPDTARKYTVVNSTSGAFTVTVKTAAGTGVIVPQGQARVLRSDGANVVDALNVDISSVYDDRVWTEFASPDREFGVTYTNSTGAPLLISITADAGSSSDILLVDGKASARFQGDAGFGQIFSYVPRGSTYSVNGTPSGTVYWFEFRR